MKIELEIYTKLQQERDILLTWYLQTLEHYDGLTTREELKREVLAELQEAVIKCNT